MNEDSKQDRIGRRVPRFSRKEIQSELRTHWLEHRWEHNRRFLRFGSGLGLLVGILLGALRQLNPDLPGGSEIEGLYMLNFALIIVLAVISLALSFLLKQKPYQPWKEVGQRITIFLYMLNFAFLSYLDMQVGPDYSTIIGFLLIFSVTMWIDTASYVVTVLIFYGLIGLSLSQGMSPLVSPSELVVEMIIFALIGAVLFYGINKVRIRNFIIEHRLEQSIEDLRELSLKDPLTRLYNRRMMNDELDRETVLSRRTGRPLAILLMDIDHFKRVNDSLGHSVGDEVLCQCASRLREVLRGSDRIYRFGGEEFLILVPNSSLPSVRALAERLLLRFSGELFDGVPWPVTMSIGVADNTERLLPSDLIKLADSRLYAAKQNGRNRYEWEGFTDDSGNEPPIP